MGAEAVECSPNFVLGFGIIFKATFPMECFVVGRSRRDSL